MATSASAHSNGSAPLSPEDHRTRGRLIEAAGSVFAEKGFDRATAKEIAARAKANPAAVNYHFGGKDRLYAAVLKEAHRRFIRLEDLQATFAAGGKPQELLRGFIAMVLHNLLTPSQTDWPLKVVAREMTAPTAALDEMIQEEARPKMLLVRRTVASVVGLPPEDPAVARCVVSIVAQCVFVFQNAHALARLFPDLRPTPESTRAYAEHVYQFSVGGLRAVAKAREKE